jgi:hypothetical protein
VRVLGRDVAEPPATVAEEEEAHHFEDPLALPRVDVAHIAELRHETALDSGLLRHLAPRGLGRALPCPDEPFRERPDVFASGTDGGQPEAPAHGAHDHAAGRELAPHAVETIRVDIVS